MPIGLQPKSGYLNLFKAGVFLQVPYRVFVSTVIGQERSMLLKAEWAIRQVAPLTVIRTINSELWIFSLSAKEDLPQPDPQFGLKEISTGVFLSSTLATGDGALPAPYNPFIQAIKHLVQQCVLLSIPDAIPFESSVMLNDNNLLYAEVYFSTTGALFFRIYSAPTELIPISREKLTIGDTIFMAPFGNTAAYYGPTSTPADSSQFWTNFQLVCSFPDKSDNFDENEWISLKLDDESLIAWPLRLCLMEKLDESTPLVHAEEPDVLVDNIWDKVLYKMNDVTKIIESDNTQSRAETLNDASTARVTQAPQNGGLLSTDVGIDVRIGDGATAVYPTPPDPHSIRLRQREDALENISWTPGAAGENWDDLDEELFGEGDGVTEADFDFFDRPEIIPEEPIKQQLHEDSILEISPNQVQTKIETVPSEGVSPDLAVPVKSDSAKEMQSTKPIVISIVRGHSDESDDGLDDENPEPKKRRKNLFAPIAFDSSIEMSIDNKYDQGGRFYVPNLGTSESEGEEFSSDEDDNISRHMSVASTGALPTTATAAVIAAATPSSYRDQHALTFGDSTVASPSKLPPKPPVETGPKSMNIGDWIKLMSKSANTENIYPAIRKSSNVLLEDDTSDEVLATIIDQTVWDNGLLSDMIPQETLCQAPDQSVLAALDPAFPELSKLSLLDFLEYVTPSGQNANNVKSEKPDNIYSGVSNPSSEVKPADDKASGIDLTKSIADSGLLAGLKHKGSISDDIGVHLDSEINQRGLAPGGPPTSMVYRQPGTNNRAGIDQTRLLSEEIMHLPAPLYSFNRVQQPLKARTPILRFWKIFGLAPLWGTKDLSVACCSPKGDGLTATIGPFLELFRSIYEDSGLGSLTLANFTGCEDGILPLDMSRRQNYAAFTEALVTSAGDIVSRIQAAHKEDQSRKRLLFIITNPYSTMESLTAFGHLIVKIKNELQDSISVAFQIIPLNFVYAQDSLVIASQYRMTRLALQAYDRFSSELLEEPLSKSWKVLSNMQRNSPAYCLARIPPIKLNFRLSTNPSLSLMEEDTVLHLSYAMSKDGKWMVVSWCDQWGGKCKVEVFSLLRQKRRIRTFEDVCAEVWDKTLGMCATKPIKWRVAILKAGCMDNKEQRAWLQLFENTASMHISYSYLLYSDVSGSLVLTGDPNLFPFGNFQQQKLLEEGRTSREAGVLASGTIGTPTTPQRSLDMDSPDMYGTNIATPTSGVGVGGAGAGGVGVGVVAAVGAATTAAAATGADGDKNDCENLTIVDIDDDAYGVLFRSRVPLPAYTSPDKLKPAIGGMLIRPNVDSSAGGPKRQMCAEFAIIYSPTPPVLTMKTFLFQYRQLTSLAQQTGVGSGIQPWHVEAVTKALRVLNNMQ